MVSLSDSTPSLAEEHYDKSQDKKASSYTHPMSYSGNIDDDPPTYISQQLPTGGRAQLQPREATVRNNSTLIDLANFLKENPIPPAPSKPVNFEPETGDIQSDHRKFVQRIFRVASKHGLTSKSSTNQNRNSDSQYVGLTATKSSERPQSRPSGLSSGSNMTSATPSPVMSFKSTASSLPLRQTTSRESELDSYVRELDLALKKKQKPRPLTNISVAKNGASAEAAPTSEPYDPTRVSRDSGLESTVKAGDAGSTSSVTSESTPKSFARAERRSSHLAGPPSPAPQRPLPPVPSMPASKQLNGTEKEGEAREESVSSDSFRLDRAESLKSLGALHSSLRKPGGPSHRLSEPTLSSRGDILLSKGQNSTSTSGSLRQTGREQRTRARKLKHLHGNSSNKDSGHSETTQIDNRDSAATSEENGNGNAAQSVVNGTMKQPDEAPEEILDAELAEIEALLPGSMSTRAQTAQRRTNANTLLADSQSSVPQNETSVDTPERNRKNRDSVVSRQQLYDRIALLERENKLLEAALMAVLKTGGSLIKCPCGGVGFERAASIAASTSKTASPASRDVTSAPRELRMENGPFEKPLKRPVSTIETPPVSAGLSTRFPRDGRNSDDRRWSLTSEDSMNWNLSRSGRDSVARSSLSSALALYTQTRAGLVGEWSQKAHSA